MRKSWLKFKPKHLYIQHHSLPHIRHILYIHHALMGFGRWRRSPPIYKMRRQPRCFAKFARKKCKKAGPLDKTTSKSKVKKCAWVAIRKRLGGISKMERTELQRLGSKEISARVRQEIKKEFPNWKVSVRKEEYSMGWSLHINIMQAPIRVKQLPEEISQDAINFYCDSCRSGESLRNMQKESNNQLNHNFGEYDQNKWCNGVFLTAEGHAALKRMAEITQPYNWDNSDSQTDYFDVNFYLHMELGKWNEAFKDGEVQL